MNASQMLNRLARMLLRAGRRHQRGNAAGPPHARGGGNPVKASQESTTRTADGTPQTPWRRTSAPRHAAGTPPSQQRQKEKRLKKNANQAKRAAQMLRRFTKPGRF